MRVTIDKAGRVVIPRRLREAVGMTAGEVEIELDGAGLHIEPVAGTGLVERDGRLVIPASGTAITDEMIFALRDADRR